MELIETPLKDCYIVKNKIFKDERGYFFESFNHKKFSQLTGWEGYFVQDNQSESTYGVVRGLHFQTGDSAQAKLVRVIKGTVLDVAVDIRIGSPTFGKVFTIELSDDNESQLFIPRGFAHGFSVISPTATFFYKCDNYYNKASEGSIDPYDKDLAVDWKVPGEKALLSEKDINSASWAGFLATL
ncbi:dTDP-4-dehydrorhamnose 3,5-epimerase [soil metagenome]